MMMLGATAARVIRRSIVIGLAPTLTGLGIGICCASVFAKVIESSLFVVHAGQISTYLIVTALIALVSLAAAFLASSRLRTLTPLEAARIR
jgi:ABC-type antimicrobial peptide transport system permease subunit